MEFVYFLIVGAIAGWLAGQVMKGSGYGLVTNIILGIIGAFVGGWLFGIIGLKSNGSLVGSIVTSAVGAMAVIFIARMIKK